nr:TPM domain-containing protein [Sphingobium abikonense]
MVLLLAFLLLALASTAQAQTFPKFDDKGVVDAANILTPQQEQALSQKLIAQKQASGRSLVVATIPDLQGYDIADYGYRLGRAWGIGDKDSNGALLIVAPSERKLRIEVGYGLEGILTDALSSQIIRTVIAPRFKAGDMVGGIDAGVDAITTLLALPPDQARAQAAKAEAAARDSQDDGGGIIAFWIILFVVFFILLPMLSRARGGRRYRRGGSARVVIWGPGLGSGWGSGSGGSGWGGGWGGGGGFSGGGSFGGGGASGDW